LTPYLGLGLGIYHLKSRDSRSGLDDVENSDNTYVAGAKFTAGIDTPSGFLAEVSYQTLPGIDGANLSGLTLAIGYRF
jgi:hypothetical protein